ncbi:MAG: hypothetical protein ACQERW_07560 [Cyanobacteriota bacterium]
MGLKLEFHDSLLASVNELNGYLAPVDQFQRKTVGSESSGDPID